MVPMREITFEVEQARTRQLTGRSINPQLGSGEFIRQKSGAEHRSDHLV